MATEQTVEDRVLEIFQAHAELMAEEVFPLYEEAFGDTSRSNSIHSALGKLTNKNLLYVIRKQLSPMTRKTVNVWKYNDGVTVPVLISSVVERRVNKKLGETLPEILRVLSKMDMLLGALPNDLKQEMFHYEVNQLREKLS